MIGAIVGQRYRIVRPIGAGGMGAVYEATDTQTGARVAVKIITAETAKNPLLMGRFEREARATMALDTPYIVRVLDAGHEGDRPFLVMELLEGEDVNQLIKRLGPLPPDLALRIVAQALQGLRTAHEARIIHRDIKPANFFLAREPGGARTLKLLDFGIAKIMRDPADSNAETAGLTSTGSMLGSPLFMSPEQARGVKEIDHRADIWSMGVVLYQALTGRTPHQSTDALGELIIAICTEVPAPIQELAPWVPPEIAAVAHNAIRFDPVERFQSAADMLAAIQPLLRGGWTIDESMLRPLAEAERGRVEARFVTVPDAPKTRAGRTTGGGSRAMPPASSIDGFGSTLGPDAARPSRGLLIAGAAVALTVGGLLAYKLFGSTGPSPTTASSAAATATSASASASVAATEAPKPRTVRLVILPEGASVEVDGVAAEVKDGVVEITGALGSVHDVRVSAGGEQVTRSVVVADSGPVPAKVQVELKTPKPGPAVRPPTPRPVATASDLRNQR